MSLFAKGPSAEGTNKHRKPKDLSINKGHDDGMGGGGGGHDDKAAKAAAEATKAAEVTTATAETATALISPARKTSPAAGTGAAAEFVPGVGWW